MYTVTLEISSLPVDQVTYMQLDLDQSKGCHGHGVTQGCYFLCKTVPGDSVQKTLSKLGTRGRNSTFHSNSASRDLALAVYACGPGTVGEASLQLGLHKLTG